MARTGHINLVEPLDRNFEVSLDVRQALTADVDHGDSVDSLRRNFSNLRTNMTALTTRVLITILQFTLVCLALWGGIDVYSRAWKVPHKRKGQCYCGNSDQEAIAMGCKYDHIAVDWLPNNCIDAALTAEFVTAGPGPGGAWDYFSDYAGLQRMNESEVEIYARNGKDYFVTRQWHIAHCSFVWRKQWRSKFTSTLIEPWNDKEEHIEHCNEYFMDGSKALDEVDTLIPGTNRHERGYESLP